MSDYSPALVRALVLGAVELYDKRGGLANDTEARHTVAAYLDGHLNCSPETAFELLADALAKRAASQSTQKE